VSIGSDILHAMPNCDGAALGQASYTDFLVFARALQDLEGGVFLNIGSAVTGPEVYLKALSMARNVARRCAPESGTGTYRPDMSQSQFPSRQEWESGTGTDRPDPSQSQFPRAGGGTGTDRPDASQSQFPLSDNGVRDKGTGTRGEPVPLSLSPLPRHFTTAVFDLVDLPNTFRDGPPTKDHPLYYYRPWKTILCRTIADGGKSYYFQGDHQQTIPTLWHELVKRTDPADIEMLERQSVSA
jgi:hypothetical protein